MRNKEQLSVQSFLQKVRGYQLRPWNRKIYYQLKKEHEELKIELQSKSNLDSNLEWELHVIDVEMRLVKDRIFEFIFLVMLVFFNVLIGVVFLLST